MNLIHWYNLFIFTKLHRKRNPTFSCDYCKILLTVILGVVMDKIQYILRCCNIFIRYLVMVFGLVPRMKHFYQVPSHGFFSSTGTQKSVLISRLWSSDVYMFNKNIWTNKYFCKISFLDTFGHIVSVISCHGHGNGFYEFPHHDAVFWSSLWWMTLEFIVYALACCWDFYVMIWW